MQTCKQDVYRALCMDFTKFYTTIFLNVKILSISIQNKLSLKVTKPFQD